jgi:Rieske Fe-S protein
MLAPRALPAGRIASLGATLDLHHGLSTPERRKFLGQGLILMVMGFSGFSGFGRRLWAHGSQPLRYRPLAQPVLVPLADLSVPGRARQFVAEGVTLASAAKPNQPVRVSGIVVRTAAGDDGPDRFKAVCVRCPHEQCDVDFIADPSRLPPELVQEIGHVVKEPVYLCPCHNSTFKDDGERLAGPAPRGLYRFRVTRVSGAAVEITEVEEDVLIFF